MPPSVAIVTTIGIGTLVGEPLGSWSGTGFPAFDGWQNPRTTFLVHLLAGAVWHGFCTLLAALIMTGLLPFIERLFDVQTDISLLELGDAAHPLLQELARRAPGTYNHSINVASLAEVGRRIDRCQRFAGSSGSLLPRHWQDVQAGLLRREPRA